MYNTKRLKKAIFKKVLSLFLAVTMLFTVLEFPVKTDADATEYSNYIDGWTVQSAWSTMSTDYVWNAERDSMKQPKLMVTYSISNASKAYPAGSITFIIPGIGAANRDGIVKAYQLAADQPDSEWSYTWDKETDTYIFTNIFEIQSGESVVGGFEILWNFKARDSESGYKQSESVTFQAGDSETITLPPISYEFTSQKDQYYLDMENNVLSYEEYLEADGDYVWYKISNQFTVDKYSRSLYKSNYFITVDVPDGISAENVVVKYGSKNICLTQDEDGKWGFYLFNDNYGNLTTSTFTIGFLKDEVIAQEEAGTECSVTISGHLDRLYNDESVWDTTVFSDTEQVDDSVTFNISNYTYDFSNAVYAYSHSKKTMGGYGNSSPYSGRLNASEIYVGKIVEFYISGAANCDYVVDGGAAVSAQALEIAEDNEEEAIKEDEPPSPNTSGVSRITGNEPYSMMLGDDKLIIYLNDGSVRNLDDSEYDITYVTVPKTSSSYDYEIYGADTQDSSFDAYVKLGEGNTKSQKLIRLPDGIKAVYLKVNDIVGKFSCGAYVGVKFHLDWNEQQKKEENQRPNHENRIVNFSYMRILYDAEWNGENYEINDYAVLPSSYTGVYSQILAERDVEVYGEGLYRDCDNIYLRSPITILKSSTDMTAFEYDGNGKFITTATSAGTISGDDSGLLKKFSLYTVLPEGLKIDLDSIDFTVTGSAVDINGNTVDTKTIAEYVTYSVKEIAGQTIVVSDFDFSGSPLELKSTTSVSVSFPVNLSSTDYIDYGGTYELQTYLMVHDEGLDKVSGTDITSDILDLDQDGSQQEKAAISSATQVINDSAIEYREHATKYIKSAYSGGAYVTDTVTKSYAAEEEEKSIYSYRLDFELGSGYATDITYYDVLENGADIYNNEQNPNEVTHIDTAWQGNFVSVDTAFAQNQGMTATVYYTMESKPEKDYTTGAWKAAVNTTDAIWEVQEGDNSEDVTAVAVCLDTTSLANKMLHPGTVTYVNINMMAPDIDMDNPEETALFGTKAVNQFYVNYKSYDLVGEYKEDVVLPSDESYVTLKDTVGNIELKKVDNDHILSVSADGTENYAPLTGASFMIYTYNSETSEYIPVLEEPVSVNSIGEITLKNLSYGTYYYEEVAAPTGYEKLEGKYAFELNSEMTTITVGNNRIPGNVTLTKGDDNDRTITALAGAEFELYTATGEQIFTKEQDSNGTFEYSVAGNNSTFTTGDDGKITVTNLPWGSYYFTEITAPEGYEINSNNINFTINQSKYDSDTETVHTEVTVLDSELSASIRLTKKDADSSNQATVKGAVYSLYRVARGNETDDVLISSGLKTNAAGEIIVVGLKFGTYYFVETQNPSGYEMPEGDAAKTNIVTLNKDTTDTMLDVVHFDYRIKGTVELSKVDDLKQLVGDAEYTLYYKSESSMEYTPYGTYKTDSDRNSDTYGTLTVNELPWGEYYFQESEAPKGYELSDEQLFFTIDKNSAQNTIYLEAEDMRKNGSVILTKVDKDDASITLAGAVFELYRTDGTKCVVDTDYTLPEGVDAIMTGDDGTIKISNLKQDGYYLKEVTAPEGYSLNTEYIRFSVTKDNCDTVQALTAKDEKGTAVLTINKNINEVYSEFGNPTFIYKIVDQDGNVYYKSITLSAENLSGSVSMTVNKGTYTIIEEKTARYELQSILDVENITFVDVDNAQAIADLTGTNESAEVTYTNELDRYDKFSHTGNVTNIVKKAAVLTGISVEYVGPENITADTEGYDAETYCYVFKNADLAVLALYDDGTSKVLTMDEYELSPAYVEAGENSYTGTVTYVENGVEVNSSFQISLMLPEAAKRYTVTFELNGGTIVPEGSSTALDSYSVRVVSGKTVSQPVNDPVSSTVDYIFDGWYSDENCTEKYNFSNAVTEDITIYACYKEPYYDVKYAVSVYGIKEDTYSEDGGDTTQTAGLTFGPAAGELNVSYMDSYVSHIPSGITDSGNEHRCIHDDDWNTIIQWSAADPYVYEQCLENGCTKSISLDMTNTGASAIKGTSYSEIAGDGTSILFNSISASYRSWNSKSSNSGGWPASRIRAVLNGGDAYTDTTVAGSNMDSFDLSSALISAFPSNLQNAIVAKAVQSDMVYNSTSIDNNVTTYDKLWLFSGKEVNSSTTTIRANEGELYSTISMNSNRRGCDENGVTRYRWLRTLPSGSGTAIVSFNGASCMNITVNNSSTAGISPGFCLK